MNDENQDENQQLKKLIEDVKKYPHSSKKRQEALTKLIEAISQSSYLFRRHSSQKSEFDRYVYSEAKQELLLYICKRIETYDPTRASVIGWVNMLLERRFIKKAYAQLKPDILPANCYDLNSPYWLNVEADSNDIEQLSLPERMKQYITSDPDEIFKKAHVKDRPDANYQAIALRYLKGQSWEQMSREFDVGVSTLSSFYSRCNGRFAKMIRNYCQD